MATLADERDKAFCAGFREGVEDTFSALCSLDPDLITVDIIYYVSERLGLSKDGRQALVQIMLKAHGVT